MTPKLLPCCRALVFWTVFLDPPKRPRNRHKTPKTSQDAPQTVQDEIQDRTPNAPKNTAKSTTKTSRDVERKVENKHFNLRSEDHAQNRQRGAARDERSEDLKSEDHAQNKTAQHLPTRPAPPTSELQIVTSSLLVSCHRTKAKTSNR